MNKLEFALAVFGMGCSIVLFATGNHFEALLISFLSAVILVHKCDEL